MQNLTHILLFTKRSHWEVVVLMMVGLVTIVISFVKPIVIDEFMCCTVLRICAIIILIKCVLTRRDATKVN